MSEKNISPEQQSYEIEDFWKPEHILPADYERVKAIAAHIPPDAHRILDVGCGGGILLNHLKQGARQFSRLCGVDRSLAALKYVQTESYACSIDELPFKDGEFDLVASIEVIEHLPQELYGKGLREIARIAKKYIIISVPNHENLEASLVQCPLCRTRYNPNFHMRSFDMDTLTALFDGLGYACLDAFGIGGDLRCKWRDRLPATQAKKDRPPPWFAICPMCGHKSDHKKPALATVNSEAGTNRLADCIRYFWPKEIRYQWIGAVFVRRGQL